MEDTFRHMQTETTVKEKSVDMILIDDMSLIAIVSLTGTVILIDTVILNVEKMMIVDVSMTTETREGIHMKVEEKNREEDVKGIDCQAQADLLRGLVNPRLTLMAPHRQARFAHLHTGNVR